MRHLIFIIIIIQQQQNPNGPKRVHKALKMKMMNKTFPF